MMYTLIMEEEDFPYPATYKNELSDIKDAFIDIEKKLKYGYKFVSLVGEQYKGDGV